MGRRRRSVHPAGIVAVVAGAALVGFPLLIAAFGVVIGLVAAVIGVAVLAAVFVLPWLALGYGVYQLVRRRRTQPRPYPLIPNPTASSPPPHRPPTSDPAARLPEDQRAQVERIRLKARGLLAQAARFPAGSRSLHLVERTLAQYLPATIDAYLALPSSAATAPVAPDGRTGLQVLRDQLDLLESRLDEVASDLWQMDVGRLLANERFLEEHFGRRDDDELTIPSARATASAPAGQ
jgi:hypothetical protein